MPFSLSRFIPAIVMFFLDLYKPNLFHAYTFVYMAYLENMLVLSVSRALLFFLVCNNG